jgi:hypothetical protein
MWFTTGPVILKEVTDLGAFGGIVARRVLPAFTGICGVVQC